MSVMYRAHAQLSSLYLLSTRYVTHVISRTRPSPFFCVQHWKGGSGLGTRLLGAKAPTDFEACYQHLHLKHFWKNFYCLNCSFFFTVKIASECVSDTLKPQNFPGEYTPRLPSYAPSRCLYMADIVASTTKRKIFARALKLLAWSSHTQKETLWCTCKRLCQIKLC